MDQFSFRVTAAAGAARVGKLMTPHGVIDTPAFVPVGTQATVKSLTPPDLKSIGSQMVLANTYHLYLQPGVDAVARLGGLRQMMGWDGPLMTDSGGFQVFSLGWALEQGIGKMTPLFAHSDDSREEIAAKIKSVKEKSLVKRKKLCLVDDQKATFLSHLDGSLHIWTPEKSIEAQKILGADLIFALDECTSPTHDRQYTATSMRRSHAWEERSLEVYETSKKRRRFRKPHLKPRPDQALYGIVQGGPFRDLRLESAKFAADHDFFGTGIGGALINKKTMVQILDWIMPFLPENRPNHLLGIGAIDDILNSVEKGIDTFDCAHPTRIARRGVLLMLPEDGGSLKNHWKLNITKAEFSGDAGKISKICRCELCQFGYSRGYLNHLFWARELLAPRLATIHNLAVMNRLMEDIRRAIAENKFEQEKKRWLD